MSNTKSSRKQRQFLPARDGLVLASVFVFTFAIHAMSPVTTSTDSAWTFHLAASIVREQDLDLDEYRELMDLDVDYRLRTIGGHVYYYYPAATPLLAVPAVIVINSVFGLTGRTDFFSYLDSHPPDDRTARFEKVVASLIVALATVGTYLIGRQTASTRAALLAAGVFAFGTSMWSTASRALWQHGPSVLLLTFAIYLALAAPQRKWTPFWTGLILAFSYLVRPTNSISLAFFGLYYLLNGSRLIWRYALGALLVFVPYAALNVHTYANVFPPYSYQLLERLATPGQFTEALAGTLVSPNRGLFIFSPVLLFAIYGARASATKNGISKSNLNLYFMAIFMCHWITVSLFEDWGGAWSIGPRYFVDVLPYLAYFLPPVIDGLPMRPPVWRYLWLTAALLSVLVQWHASVSIYPFMWNGKPRALVDAPERKWDWGDLQFLRGFCQGDRLEGRAPACWMERIE